MKIDRKRLFHFSYGNSIDGPIGYYAAILADTEAEAAERLRKLLRWDMLVAPLDATDPEEYIEVYFNPRFVSEEGIDNS